MLEYFTKVEQEYGITLTNTQKWWYASKYEELGYEIKIVDVRPEDNVVLVRGQIPGPRQGIVILRKLK